jgi:WD40 repeat protein
LAVAGWGLVEVFDLVPTPTSILVLPLEGPHNGVALSPDGRFLAVGDSGFGEQPVRLFDIKDAKAALPKTGPAKRAPVAPVPVGWTRNKPAFAVVVDPTDCPWLSGITVLKPSGPSVPSASGPSVPVRAFLRGHSRGVDAMSFTPDGQKLITGDRSGTLRCWSVPAGRLLWQTKAHGSIWGGTVETICCLPKKVVSGGDDGRISVTDLKTGKVDGKMLAHRRMVESLAVSPDGKKAASFGADNLLTLWDLEKKRRLGAINIQLRQAPAVYVLPSGAVLCYYGSVLRLFVPKGGKLVEDTGDSVK